LRRFSEVDWGEDDWDLGVGECFGEGLKREWWGVGVRGDGFGGAAFLLAWATFSS
jgi:hypothetical protein